jgi:hypothetical protein
MTRHKLFRWLACAGASLAALAYSLRSLHEARAGEERALAELRLICAQASEIQGLSHRFTIDSATPASRVGPLLAEAVGAAGLQATSIAAISPSPLVAERLPGAQLVRIRQRVTVELADVSLPALGRLLGEWSARAPGWMPTAIDIGDPDRPGRSAMAETALRVSLTLESTLLEGDPP